MKNNVVDFFDNPISFQRYIEDQLYNDALFYEFNDMLTFIGGQVQNIRALSPKYVYPNKDKSELWYILPDANFADMMDEPGTTENNIDYSDCFPNWIITDVRFQNELNAILKRGGILLRVNRSICPNCNEKENFHFNKITNQIDYCNNCGHEWSTHESETALDNYKNWNHIIDNSGTMEELINIIRSILSTNKII